MTNRTEWPKWMYGPDDAARIFQKDDQVPKGWADHPDKVKQPEAGKQLKLEKKDEKKTDALEPTPEERADTIRSIREAAAAQGIDIQLADDASVEEINAAIDKLTKE
jgi:hypothetical protein